MTKKFSKILAMILTLGMIASFCAVPMSASADAPATSLNVTPPEDETYAAYDVVGYDDLLVNGDPVAAETTMGNRTFTFDQTSPTASTIFAFRWKAVAGSKFQLSFDKKGDGVCNMFGVQLYTAGSEGHVNDSIRLRPGHDDANAWIDLDNNIVTDQYYDVEFARLKVVSGTNAGKYLVYFKLDGAIISASYVAANVVDGSGNYTQSGTQIALSNVIYMTFWGQSGNKISGMETYDAYDTVNYSDFRNNGSPLADTTDLGSARTFTYNATSPSYSSILKFRWTAGNPKTDASYFALYFDAWAGSAYPFCLAVKGPNQSNFGAVAGEYGAWDIDPSTGNGDILQMTEPIVYGADYDIEYGRLKVVTGANRGKYYVYLKVNDVLTGSYYYDGVASDGRYKNNTGTLSNTVLFNSSTGTNFISAITTPDVYDEYDEVYYSNFLKDGSPMSGEYSINSKKFTYNKTSQYGSAVLKYRWKGANTGSSFYISFDPPPKSSDPSQSATEYTFGVLYSGSAGTIWLRIGNGSSKSLTTPLTMGEDYDIEYGRIKIISGTNAGKYKLFIKISDANGVEQYYEEKFIEASVVDENGQYTSNTDGAGSGVTCTISNSFYISFWGNGGGNKITNPAYTETYYDYDVVTYDDFRINGNPLSESGTDLGSTRTITYNVTSDTYSSVLKFRWTAGNQTFKTSDGSPQAYFVLYYDAWAGSAYPFCFAVKGPNQAGFGATAGEYGSWDLNPSISNNIVHMSEPIVNGNTYDIECGRIKVATGPHKGNYYVFLKVDGELISSYYYDGSNSDGTYGSGSKIGTFSNTILFTSSNNTNKISAIPVPETYEDYDEIGYADLLKNGEPLRVGGADMSGGTTFTYNRTSDTYSVILKYLWKVGSKQKFQLSFDKYGDNTMSYMFGAWLSAPGEETGFDNGRMWLKPGGGPQVDLPSVLTTGSSYNVEFARLKVKTGRNTGKYYMYVKIDDTLIAETYVDASGIATDGTYTSNTDKTFTLSNEIQLNFWGSEHNAIAPYKMTFAGQEGVTADFDDDGVLNASDLVVFRKILLGIIDLSELADGIADFNKDSAVDIRDLVAFKKYLAPVNTYAKSGSLNLGMQEHLLESDGSFVDNTKTATYIADASATMGADTYRLSKPIHSLFYVTSTNGVTVASDNMAQFKAMVAALTAQGITNILYVTDSLMLPYGYSNPSINHNKTCPTPGTQDYEDWLTVNANAFAALATEVPEIKFFEPFNEINLSDTGFEKPGIPWNASASVAANYKYTVAEKAGIMADLCWYISRAVKGVDAANQVTTPSITVGTESIIENNFMSALYNAIDSGAHPAFKASGDKRADNYFTIVNIHAYPEYVTGSSSQDTKVNNIASMISSNIYSIMQAHNDGGSRVWLTETGVSIFGSRTESNGASLLSKFLNKINTNMTYIDTVIFYKVADASASSSITEPEKKFGLFYAGDASSNAYGAKQTAKTVYSFFHNGSTDYSALTALANRYN